MTITATYSPEDNKIRLYPSRRLDGETFARVKAAGFIWAPKQELFVAPSWSPAREDLARELAGDIEPEEMTMAERAAAKAERLDNLAAKRASDASAFRRAADRLSERFAMGQPILVGHHSERSARRDHDRMTAADAKARKARDASKYWLYRADGVERFANMKSAPGVRARRIKTLLAELRDLQRDTNAAHGALAIWAKLETDEQIRFALGNIDSRATCSTWDTYSDVDKGRMTPAEARRDCIARAESIISSPVRRRWIDHTLHRLAYERELLGPVRRYDGALSPVILQAFAREHGTEKPVATALADGLSWSIESPVPLPLHIGNGALVEMTGDEWRDLMQSAGYEVPAKTERRASSKPTDPPLVNPAREEGERLQALWNERAAVERRRRKLPEKAAPLRLIDQATYSENSKGDFSVYRTIEIDATGRHIRGRWKGGDFVKDGDPVARIRVRPASDYYVADSVIIIEDKAGKPLPLDWEAIAAELAPAGEVAA